MATLVTGATGTVGRDVVDGLRARGPGDVRPASRNGEAVAGVPGVRLDFDEPATWSDALAGMRRLFLVRPPAMSRVGSLLDFADAAVEAGVERVVFLSLLGAEQNPLLPHRKVERHLEELAPEAACLRAGFFMQNLTGPHRRDIAELDEIVVPAGNGRTSFVDTRDLAAAAVRLLTDPNAEARPYDLTGPEALSYHDVAEELTRVLGRRIRYTEPSLFRFARVMRRRGHPWGYIVVMSAIYTTTRLGKAARVTDELGELLDRPPTSFRRFAEDHREAWRAG